MILMHTSLLFAQDSEIERLLGIATEFKAKDDYKSALLYCDKALQLRKSDGMLWENRARCYTMLNELEKALSDYDQAILLSSWRPAYYTNRATVKLMLKDTIGAIADYRYAVEKEYKATEAHFNLGVLLIAQKKFDGVYRLFKSCVENNINLAQSQFYIGYITYIDDKDPERAVYYYARSRESDNTLIMNDYYEAFCNYDMLEYGKAIPLISNYLKKSPKDVSALYLKGLCLLQKRQHYPEWEKEMKEAMACSDSCIAIDPRNVNYWLLKTRIAIQIKDYQNAQSLISEIEKSLPNSADLFMEKARLAMALNKRSEAKAFLSEVLKLNRQLETEVDLLWGILLFEENNPQGALGYLEWCLRKQPKMFEALLYQSKCFLMDNKFEESEKALRDYMQKSDQLDEGYRVWSQLLMAQNNTKEALQKIEAAIQENPVNEMSFVDMGNILQKINKSKQAIESFDQAIKTNGLCAPAFIGKGNALVNQGKLDEGYSCFIMAEKINPDIPDSQIGMGIILSKKKSYEDAIQVFNKVLEKHPRNSIAHFELGKAYLAVGKKNNACSCFESCVFFGFEPATEYRNKYCK